MNQLGQMPPGSCALNISREEARSSPLSFRTFARPPKKAE